MEPISGVSSWKLTVRREAEHVEILRAVTCQEKAVLPDRLFGLPVTVLGAHALSPTASQIEGEEVLVTCGPLGEDPGWDNHRLRDLTMPRHLKQVGDYALLNCDALETLRLWDDVRRWSGGTLGTLPEGRTFCQTLSAPARLVIAMALCRRAFSQENFIISVGFLSISQVGSCVVKKKRINFFLA